MMMFSIFSLLKFDVDFASKWNSLATADLWPTKSDTVASGGIYALTLLGWIFSNLSLPVDAAVGILSKRKMRCNELWFAVEFNSEECSSHPAVPLLSPISRFRQIGFVSGKWKKVTPTHATLYERKTSQQLFLEDWMLEKRLLHCTYCSIVHRLCFGVGKNNGQYVSTWLAWIYNINK